MEALADLRFVGFAFHPRRNGVDGQVKLRKGLIRRQLFDADLGVTVRRFGCRCSGSVVPIRRGGGGSAAGSEKAEEWHLDSKKRHLRPEMPFASPKSHGVSKQNKFYSRCSPRNTGPQSRDTPPKRDTGIANEKDWGIDLLNENVSESGINEDGSTWYRESGEDLGENGYRCRWTRMGGQSHDGSSEWTETWWEKSDWTGYKELGVEKSGRNAEGDSWWETWQEVLHQDEWSNLARIERSAQKQAKSGTENAGWYEKWWEKYDAKGWAEKGAHKYGRLNEQSWWEKWGEHYDGRGSVLKWTDKWAEAELGTKWGDKWEEKFFAGIGSRQGETWHAAPSAELRSTSTGRARREKTGISSWMRKPITRRNHITDGRMLWAIPLSCCQSNHEKDHLVCSQISTSGRLLLWKPMNPQDLVHLRYDIRAFYVFQPFNTTPL